MEASLPQAIIADWWGPFPLTSAADLCGERKCEQGVYLVVGRHRRFGWWPLWWNNQWKRSRLVGNYLTTRLTNYPVQYVGIGVNLSDRLRYQRHKKLRRLDPNRSWIFVAKPKSQLHDGTKGPHQTAVKALEDALIYAFQPRLNERSTRNYLGGELGCWLRPATEPNSRLQRYAKSLPSMLLADGQRELLVEARLRRQPIPLAKLSRRPVGSLSVYLERHHPRLFRTLFGIDPALGSQYKRDDEED